MTKKIEKRFRCRHVVDPKPPLVPKAHKADEQQMFAIIQVRPDGEFVFKHQNSWCEKSKLETP